MHSGLFTKLATGAFETIREPKFVEEDFFLRRINETNEIITFLTNKYVHFMKIMASLLVPILSYFLVILTGRH